MEAPPISLPDWIDEDAEDGGFNFDDALSAEGKPLTDEELASFFAGVLQVEPVSPNQRTPLVDKIGRFRSAWVRSHCKEILSAQPRYLTVCDIHLKRGVDEAGS